MLGQSAVQHREVTEDEHFKLANSFYFAGGMTVPHATRRANGCATKVSHAATSHAQAECGIENEYRVLTHTTKNAVLQTAFS